MVDSNWKEKYPFLEEIWKKYINDEFVNDGGDHLKFSLSCVSNVSHRDLTSVTEQIDICTKFLRNLKSLYTDAYDSGNFEKRCNNIYYWLYYEMKERKDYKGSIKNIIDASNELIQKPIEKDGCYNSYLYENFDETEKLVMLQIFIRNIVVIQEILNNKCDSNRTSCKKFIKECVDLYSMQPYYSQTCNNPNSIIDKTCLAVKSFKEKYEELRSSQKIKNEFPPLSTVTPEINIDLCLLEERKTDQAFPLPSNQSEPSIIQR
ncbi:hypothetical protein PCYB_007060, partial [Plasmodium cynomolgi strain B]